MTLEFGAHWEKPQRGSWSLGLFAWAWLALPQSAPAQYKEAQGNIKAINWRKVTAKVVVTQAGDIPGNVRMNIYPRGDGLSSRYPWESNSDLLIQVPTRGLGQSSWYLREITVMHWNKSLPGNNGCEDYLILTHEHSTASLLCRISFGDRPKITHFKDAFSFPFLPFFLLFFCYRDAAATPGKTITGVVEDSGAKNLMGKSKQCVQ